MPDRFELKDLKAGAVTLFIVGVPLLVGAALWIATWMPGVDTTVDAGRPEPRLSPKGSWGAELDALHRQEAVFLESYGWVDRPKGIARIPVDRAMDLFLEQVKR